MKFIFALLLFSVSVIADPHLNRSEHQMLLEGIQSDRNYLSLSEKAKEIFYQYVEIDGMIESSLLLEVLERNKQRVSYRALKKFSSISGTSAVLTIEGEALLPHKFGGPVTPQIQRFLRLGITVN